MTNQEIRDLLGKISKWPWLWFGGTLRSAKQGAVGARWDIAIISRGMEDSSDATFIGASPQIVSDLLERLETAEALVRELLGAGTHAVNDYNCEEWPPGEPCSGCKGDNIRAAVREKAREAGIMGAGNDDA